jgi:hypothetical protein
VSGWSKTVKPRQVNFCNQSSSRVRLHIVMLKENRVHVRTNPSNKFFQFLKRASVPVRIGGGASKHEFRCTAAFQQVRA